MSFIEQIIAVGPTAAGSAPTTNPVQIAGTDGTDVREILTDSTGQVKVLIENSPTVTAEVVGHAGAILDGTAGSPSTGVVTVQGVSGGTTVPVSGTVSVNALPTGTNTIGKVDVLGNAGATLDSTIGPGTAPTNMLAVGGQYNSAPTELTNGQTEALQLDPYGAQKVSTENAKPSYMATQVVQMATNATDVVVMTGSSTKTVRITRVTIQLFNATSSGIETLVLYRMSTANSGGTSATVTAAQKDNNDASSTATFTYYTANPTSLGTRVHLLNYFVQFVNAGWPNATPIVLSFGGSDGRGFVLRGTSDYFVVNLNGSSPANSFANVIVEWTEE